MTGKISNSHRSAHRSPDVEQFRLAGFHELEAPVEPGLHAIRYLDNAQAARPARQPRLARIGAAESCRSGAFGSFGFAGQVTHDVDLGPQGQTIP